MADVNVLGLNIELQLRSQKFEDALKAFVDGQVSKISEDLSQMMTKAIDAIDFWQAVRTSRSAQEVDAIWRVIRRLIHANRTDWRAARRHGICV